MFLFVRTPVLATSLLVALIASAPAAAATAPPPVSSGPSNAEIQAAIKQVKRSKDLWATINICNTRTHANAIGIRGQMPGLGFRTKLSMEFQVHYWSVKEKRFKLIKGADTVINIGSKVSGLHQDGVTFRFAPHAGFLASTVSFNWTLGSKSIGSLTRWSSKGHPDADGGDPPHYSAGRCVIA
jgi:hypothetical protein